jgi:hypothetical protein
MPRKKKERERYIEIDRPLVEKYDMELPVHESFWELPHINFEKVPGWKDMSKTERVVCMCVNDPFLFHHAVLGYDPHAVQGEWLYMFAKHKDVILLAPVGFGKSINASVTYPLWRYLRNCNIRVAIVSAADDLTNKYMRALDYHLTTNPRFLEIFETRWGHVPKPDRKGSTQWKWSVTEKICYRTKEIGVDDSTFFGSGLYGAIFGRRFDLIIMDDAYDPKWYESGNPDVVNKIASQQEGNLFTRIDTQHGTGEIKIIGTVDTSWDMYMHMLSNTDITFQVYKYRAIRRKGMPHRIDVTEAIRRKAAATSEENDGTDSIMDIMNDTGL